MLKNITNKLLLIAILLSTLLIITGCNNKQKNYLHDSIAIVYKNNKPYLINKSNELYDLSYYDSIIPNFGDILIVKKNNLFGYIKNTGEPLTEIIYNEAYPFSEDKAVVSLNNSYHIINTSGEIIYDFEQGVISYSYFSENKLVITKEEKQGYLKYDVSSNQFSYLIESTESDEISLLDTNLKYDYCSEFRGGYAVVGNLNEENQLKYTHIKENGERLYDLEWDYANNFSEGYAVVGNNITYSIRVYCGNVNDFDDRAQTTVKIMGYMYVNTEGKYIGTSYVDPETSEETIIPDVYAKAQDFKDDVAIVARLFFYASKKSNSHVYDFSTERYFYNYDFINTKGEQIYGEDSYELFGSYNNWGGNIIIYDDIFRLDNFYITTFFKSCWYVYYTPVDSLNPVSPFMTATYDIKEYKTVEEIEKNFPWVIDYLKEFTIGNNNAIYAADKVISPYTLSNFKQSKYLDNKFVAKAQSYSGMEDSCGIISVEIINEKPQLSYVIPPLYEEIIY